MDKVVGEKITRACESLIQMLKLTFQGFRLLTKKSLGEAESVRNEVRQHCSELTKYLVSKSSSPIPLRRRVRLFPCLLRPEEGHRFVYL
jgi:hypothetical protein